ncbi:MAG TPA: hypothetical protein VMF64_10450 [Steroidobacteraceae bacterium]|nr:hypothetical protein [Steroidobacteraceae bacterium]
MSLALRSYLFVYLFCLALSLGSLANLMLHQLTGGRWGEALRAPLSAAASLLPVVALFALPLLIDLPAVFQWMSDPGSVADKHWWLNRPFFLARSAFYLVLWSLLSLRWRLLAARTSAPRSPALIRFSAAGLILYGFSVSLAAVDWIMSLTPHWYSSTFGLWIGVAAMQAALALAVCGYIGPLAWAALRGGSETRRSLQSAPLRALCGDFANLLLMYVLGLTYLSYTQYLIVWAEDLPQEISWYLPRLTTNWRNVTVTLVLLQFLLPFLLLLVRSIKRDARYLAGIAAALLLSQLLLFFYLVKPAFMPAGLALRWSDPVLVLICVGAWLAAWLQRWQPTSARP